MKGPTYRINFRVQPNANLSEELDRLARIVSAKYGRDLKIILRETGRKR